MRTRERKRSDRRWVPWSAGTAAGRLPTVQLQAHVERLEARHLLASPHFISASVVNAAPTAIPGEFTLSSQNLTVAFKEAGLAANTLIDYELTATANVTYESVNNGNNHPQASNKEQLVSEVTEPGQFSSGKNGNVTGSLTVSPPPSTLTIPSGQSLQLQVTYTNIKLFDTTKHEEIDVPGSYTFTSSRFVPI